MKEQAISIADIAAIKEIYKDNKKSLKKITAHIDKYGSDDCGNTDPENSFEQGYNNAIEEMCEILSVKLHK